MFEEKLLHIASSSTKTHSHACSLCKDRRHSASRTNDLGACVC
jgi:hypothetical protein